MPVRNRPIVFYAMVIAALLGGGLLLHELGRLNAGYSYLDQRRERDELTAEIAERDARIEELQRQIAILETSQEVDQETYAQVEQSLKELQAQIQAQEEELAFYRGIISPEDGTAGLRVQSVRLRRTDESRGYMLHLVLVQAITHDRRVSGTVTFGIAGVLDGEEVQLELDDVLADGSTGALAYGFRYFQDLQRQLILPEGFEPVELLMRIRPREPSGQDLEQTFEWSAIAG